MKYAPAVTLDAPPFAQLEHDPYPTYRRWRAESPVGYFEPLDTWMVTRFDDCDAIGKAEEKLSSDISSSFHYFGPNILNMAGEEHRQVRNAVDASLRPKAVRQTIEQTARPVVRSVIGELKDTGGVDATTELLERVSVRVVGNLMGLGELDDATLQRWFHDLSAGMTDQSSDPVITQCALTAKQESADFARAAFRRLTDAPDDSMFAHLMHTDIDGDEPRTVEELIGTIWVIVLGGFQEPGHAAAASLLGMLQNEEQYAAVRANADLVPAAIHEGLRWIAPFGSSPRRARVDLDVAGVTIPAGDELSLMIASANHDETRYERPEAFNLFRPRLPVASFGYGAHFCAGHFLAREIERVALEELIVELPNLRLDPEREVVVHGFDARGVKHLPVRWDG